MQIQIEVTHAKTGMTHHRPPMQITQRPAELSIQQNPGSVQMSKTDGKLTIDQTEAFADAGLKGILRRNNEMAAKANQQVLAYIAKVARDGEQLKRIEEPGNKIAMLAKERGRIFEHELAYRQVPSGTEKVRISYEPSQLSVTVTPADVAVNVTPHRPQIDAPRWSVDTYVTQKPDVRVTAPRLDRTI
ncbi:DUF6470 family protein [Bacillus daqingensis]|uniref:DUF6470 family protein n=1 Tax=Bacillus daqingensis TaxID=872396 RepID=A0ABV9NVN2_9BACI